TKAIGVVRGKEKKLIAPNRTAERSAKLVVDEPWLDDQELIARVQVLQIVQPEEAAVKVVGSALRNNVNVARHCVGDFRRCDALRHVDFGDGFRAYGFNVVEVSAH